MQSEIDQRRLVKRGDAIKVVGVGHGTPSLGAYLSDDIIIW
jgi:hypothetical protein